MLSKTQNMINDDMLQYYNLILFTEKSFVTDNFDIGFQYKKKC